MEYIINTILNILDQNNITFYSFAKTTKISRSTLYKILHFERTLKPKYFYIIIENLPLSIMEKENLIKKYRKLTIGDEEYESESHILNLFRRFSNLSISSSLVNGYLPLPKNSDIAVPSNTVYRGSMVQSVINLLFIEEMNKIFPSSYVYVPGNSSYISSYIENTVRLYNSDIKITFIFDLLQDNSLTNDNYNLKVLENIIPIALASPDNYEFYYTYTNAVINKNYMTPYPYFITFSSKILFISPAFDEVLVVNNERLAKNIKSKCESKLTKYRKFINIQTDISDIVKNIVKNQKESSSLYSIEYEPCFSMFLNEEMVENILSKDIDKREILKEIFLRRCAQLEKLSKSIQIFNKNSLYEFAETGIIKEYPPGYARRFTKDERIFLLENLLKAMGDDKYIIAALNQDNFQITDTLSITIQDESLLQFTVISDTFNKYISITENSIIRKFYNFILNLINTNMVYTPKETKEFIVQAINIVKNS